MEEVILGDALTYLLGVVVFLIQLYINNRFSHVEKYIVGFEKKLDEEKRENDKHFLELYTRTNKLFSIYKDLEILRKEHDRNHNQNRGGQ